MNLVIGDYRVSISVKPDKKGYIRGEAETTKAFLNELGLYLSSASQYEREAGLIPLADYINEMRTDIYNYLDSKGYYDDVKEEVEL